MTDPRQPPPPADQEEPAGWDHPHNEETHPPTDTGDYDPDSEDDRDGETA
jgi:hypothetical protein